MSKPYTLRKTKGGPRMMTLSSDMERRMTEAPIDAVRLTLDMTFKAITDLTGDAVVLDTDQGDRLNPRLNEPTVEMSGDQYLLWRWIIQGARVQDTRDMAHLLEVASLAVSLLAPSK